MFLFIIILFFLSGVSSLIYQMVWLKKLHLIFGVTTPSVVAILIAFMSGLSFGSFILGKYSSKFKRPFLVYALMEGLIGIYAYNIDSLFSLADKFFIITHNQFSNYLFINDFFRFLLSFVILFIPTFLMGGTLPILTNGLERLDSNFGKKISVLYGANTLGAFSGTFLSTFYLIPYFGYKFANNFAYSLNFMIFFLSFFLINIITPLEKKEENIEINLKSSFFIIIFFMGFTSFGYEVLWNRVLILHTGSNVYSYGLVLCNILIGIGLGSLFFSIIFNKIKDYLRTLAWIEFFMAIFCLFQIYILINFTEILTFFAKLPYKNASAQIFWSLFLGSFILLFFPTFLMGLSFPVSVRIMAKKNENPGKITGKVYALNTLGCIIGTFITGLVLIPLLGTTKSFLIITSINIFLAFYLFKNKLEKKFVFLVFSLILVLFLFLPPNLLFFNVGVYRDSIKNIIAFKEDITGAIIAIQKEDGLSLEINGINVAGTSPELFLIQKLQGHIPLLLSKNPEKVLHIGLGSGGTLNTVSKYPVKEIYVAEISPGIVEVASKYFKMVNDNVFSDKRVKIKISDGRNYVLASKEKFDIILSDSIHPKYIGNGFLYTKDYFNLIYQKTTSDGLASMWLPLYSLTLKNYKEILKAFSDVFPYVTVWWFPTPMNSFTIVTGSKAFLDFNNFLEKMQEKNILDDLAEINLENKERMLASLILNEKTLKYFLKNTKPHIDDLPTVEYESNKVFTKTKTWLIILKDLQKFVLNTSIDLKNLNINEEIYKNYKREIYNEMERQIKVLERSAPF